MAILGNIRKRTTVLILIIGLALFAFVISQAIDGGTGSGTFKTGSALAEINGDEISVEDFRRKVEVKKCRPRVFIIANNEPGLG